MICKCFAAITDQAGGTALITSAAYPATCCSERSAVEVDAILARVP